MPLRDHFDVAAMRPVSWDMVHGMLPGMLVLDLSEKLPEGYTAGPFVHLGHFAEVDIAAFEPDVGVDATYSGSRERGGVTAVEPMKPSTSFETEVLDQDEYEVRIYDERNLRTLVAAIESVSPSNKDRADHRRAFVSKCHALLQNHVSVSIIDCVTTRDHNLYRNLRNEFGYSGPDWEPPIYAVTCRMNGRRLNAWEFPLAIGQPLPTLPIWLTDDFHVPLDLEPSYEKTCKALRIL
jgi:hypothetical protein